VAPACSIALQSINLSEGGALLGSDGNGRHGTCAAGSGRSIRKGHASYPLASVSRFGMVEKDLAKSTARTIGGDSSSSIVTNRRSAAHRCPRGDCLGRHPQRQAAALRERPVVLPPIFNLVLCPRDPVAARFVVLVRHLGSRQQRPTVIPAQGSGRQLSKQDLCDKAGARPDGTASHDRAPCSRRRCFFVASSSQIVLIRIVSSLSRSDSRRSSLAFRSARSASMTPRKSATSGMRR
jgi:hypothetical protein